MGPSSPCPEKRMASEEEKSDQLSEEKVEKKKHRGIPEALFLVCLLLHDFVNSTLSGILGSHGW